MKHPIAIFDYSLISQARYICFLAKGIVDGIYQKGNFLVLPYQVSGNLWTVHFPDLNYSREFWLEIAKVQHNDFSKPFSKLAEGEILAKLKFHDINKKLENQWKTQEQKFWQLCEEFLSMEKVINKIKEVRIIPTEFGTFGSYYPNAAEPGHALTFSSRNDVNAQNIVRLLLLNLYNITLRDPSEIGEIDWYKRQAVAAFLTQKTVFSKLFRTEKTDTTNSKHVQDSKTYLAKLGFPPLETRDYANLENILTVKERALFYLLKGASGNLVGFDAIGDALWPNRDDKFSLYAITKLVEGLRGKIRSTGLDASILKTSKGQGYFLQ